MVTKELAERFYQTYRGNFDLANEWNEKLLDVQGEDAWVKIIVERSKVIRKAFAENEEVCRELKDAMPEPLDEESTDQVYEILTRLFYEAYDDFYVMTSLGEKLLRFYEDKRNYERALILCNLLGYETSELYGFLAGKDMEEEATKYYRKVIRMKDHYPEIRDPLARKCFFNAYDNLISPLSQFCQSLRPVVFSIYREAMDLWNSPSTQELDAENEEIQARINMIKEDMLYIMDFVEELPTKDQEAFHDLVERMGEENKANDISGCLFRARLTSDYLTKKRSVHEIIELITKRILFEIPEPDFEDEDQYKNFEYLLDAHNTAFLGFDMIKKPECSDKDREQFGKDVVQKLTMLHQKVPYSFCTNSMHNVCALWYQDAEIYCKTENEKEELLIRMLVCRQPITYIHSLMVSKIAAMIAEKVLDVNPLILSGARGYHTAEALREHREEVLSYIERCGMLHDVGKCAIAAVINQQNRRLCDEEFGMIRRHPEYGLEIIKNSEVLSPYFDVINGHHKTFDGKGGYPDSYDRTKSSVQGVVDLITISDSTDAAADILGRNYTEGKDFDHLLEELAAGAGTRYHPEIVRIIKEDADLCRRLKDITSKGRYDIYYQAYRQIQTLGGE